MVDLGLFLKQNWSSVLFVIVFFVFLAWLAKKGYGFYVKKILFYLVTQAEEEFGGGTGEIKYAAVVAWLFDRLPLIAQILLPPKTIDRLIEEAVEKMKKYLEENEKARNFVETASAEIVGFKQIE